MIFELVQLKDRYYQATHLFLQSPCVRSHRRHRSNSWDTCYTKTSTFNNCNNYNNYIVDGMFSIALCHKHIRFT